MQYEHFHFWIFSLNMFLRFLQVVLCINDSLILVAEWHSIVWLYYTFLLNFPIGGHLHVLSLLVIMTEVSMNEYSWISILWCMFSLSFRSGIDGSKGRYVFNSIIDCQFFSKYRYCFTRIQIMYANSDGLHPLYISIANLLNYNHYNGCEVIFRYAFN